MKRAALRQIHNLYTQGVNIAEYLREETATTEDILISYDLQAGAYMKAYCDDPTFRNAYSLALARVLEGLDVQGSLLEVGVGEATTLGPLLRAMPKRFNAAYGFDISWSRIKYARQMMAKLGVGATLFVGDLFSIPLKDSSIDIVYTSHSIEPNGGREAEALAELYRITGRYLVLLEPCYELANKEARARMKKHGYITRLFDAAKQYEVIEHRLFDLSANPLNPTGLTIIRKGESFDPRDPLCCPVTKAPIAKMGDAYYSTESMLAYPVIGGIPCLLPENAVIATKFLN